MSFDLIQYDKIHYYKNVIDKSNEIVELLESTDHEMSDSTVITKWSDWNSSDGNYIFGKLKKENIQYTDKNFIEIQNTVDNIKKHINNVSIDYKNIHNLEIGKLMPISFSKYFVGKQMGPHCDNYGGSISGPSISVVCYLNDNYEGGELYFKNQNIKIKPESGSIIIFPSNEPFLHQSLEIKSGVKYICPGFWYNLV